MEREGRAQSRRAREGNKIELEIFGEKIFPRHREKPLCMRLESGLQHDFKRYQGIKRG